MPERFFLVNLRSTHSKKRRNGSFSRSKIISCSHSLDRDRLPPSTLQSIRPCRLESSVSSWLTFVLTACRTHQYNYCNTEIDLATRTSSDNSYNGKGSFFVP